MCVIYSSAFKCSCLPVSMRMGTVIENNLYFSNLLIIIEDHPVVLSLPFHSVIYHSSDHIDSTSLKAYLLPIPSPSTSFFYFLSLVSTHFLSPFPSLPPPASFSVLLYPSLLPPSPIPSTPGTNEVGIPVQFAKVLHYPTPVNDFNIRYRYSRFSSRSDCSVSCRLRCEQCKHLGETGQHDLISCYCHLIFYYTI
jgi:hypothetical protein